MSNKVGQATKNPPITAIGDLVADVIVAVPSLPAEAGQHQIAQEVRLEPGGGANFLIAGARLGYPLAALGALGDDVWGQQVAGLLAAEGVDLGRVRHEGRTTRVIVLVSEAGDHVFLGAYGHGPAVPFEAADADLIKKSGAVFCAGYTLRESRLVDLTVAALRLAKSSGVPIFFDPGPQMAEVPDNLRQTVLPLVDTLLLTEEEIPLLTDGGGESLLVAGPQMVVVKQGAAGCTIHHPGQSPRTVPGYAVPVVDTAAAGDSFDAAFIVATLWDWPPVECARLANAVGAATVQKLGGGRSVPTLAEVKAVDATFEIGLKI